MAKIVVTLSGSTNATRVIEGISGISVDQWGNLKLGKQHNGDPVAIFRAGIWDSAQAHE